MKFHEIEQEMEKVSKRMKVFEIKLKEVIKKYDPDAYAFYENKKLHIFSFDDPCADTLEITTHRFCYPYRISISLNLTVSQLMTIMEWINNYESE